LLEIVSTISHQLDQATTLHQIDHIMEVEVL